jgi:hypothetical protein
MKLALFIIGKRDFKKTVSPENRDGIKAIWNKDMASIKMKDNKETHFLISL